MSKENIVIDANVSAIETRGLVKNVLKNDDLFTSWYQGYENSLNDIFFHAYPVGDENIDTYEYMGNEKLCVAIWNDTYENVVSELWGHARLRHLEIPLDWLDEKVDEADINKSDQIGISEIEKDMITLFGGGDINLPSDGPKREGGEYV
ncbi:hypothetical protein RZE82_06515 [Mollicutes bacterium LVI A0039]|nr:hypothetical protein RZE82_06515 [Mollicutes bacterium LVI A0039]